MSEDHNPKPPLPIEDQDTIEHSVTKVTEAVISPTDMLAIANNTLQHISSRDIIRSLLFLSNSDWHVEQEHERFKQVTDNLRKGGENVNDLINCIKRFQKESGPEGVNFQVIRNSDVDIRLVIDEEQKGGVEFRVANPRTFEEIVAKTLNETAYQRISNAAMALDLSFFIELPHVSEEDKKMAEANISAITKAMAKFIQVLKNHAQNPNNPVKLVDGVNPGENILLLN